MKLICILLSIYVLFLSTVPCCADDNCVDEVETVNVADHRQDHDDDECTNCSQFLNCGSCSGFVFLNLDTFKYYSLIEPLILFHTPLSTNDFISPIWQPPKFKFMRSNSACTEAAGLI